MIARDSAGVLSVRTKWIIAISVVLTAAVLVWAVAASRGDRRLAGPQSRVTQDMPGMEMSTDGSAQLTPAQIAQFGITFGNVEERTLSAEARTTGVVTFDETRMTKVAPKFAGFVERLHVDFTGQAVRRGQPLLDIYSPALVAAQEELLLARRLERTVGESAVPGVPSSTTDLLGAARRRLRLWDISEPQIEEILRTGAVRRTLTLYAPASGVVVEKQVLAGQAVDAGMTLYTLADLSRVWVDVQLRESDATLVQQGTAAALEISGLPGRLFEGRVEYVYPTLDSASRAVRARIALPNAGRALMPGMYATVRLRTPVRRALTVPMSAVLQTGKRNLVFVDMGGGRLMPHDVEIGRSAGEYSEVLAGVEPGQRVVTSAQFLLESESNLGEVMRSMMGQGVDRGMADMPGMEMKGADMRGMPTAPRPKSPGR
ncbi:MAG: efflux RND transporter periplasmic adaptor subunit [Gemmatimonadaceae bacterium]